MADGGHDKPMKFYVDFENVHGAGLKGIDELDERDEVLIFYSQAAETLHIEHAIDILKSRARVQFVEVDGGTRNAADFQLIVALVGAMDDAFDYAIVTGDGGFDAAIKMIERMGLPNVRRVSNVRGEVIEVEKPKSRRSRRRGGSSSGGDESAGERTEKPTVGERAKGNERSEKLEGPEKTLVDEGGERVEKSVRVESKGRPEKSKDDESNNAAKTPEESAHAENAPGESVSAVESAASAPSEESKRSRGRRRRGSRKINHAQNADDAQGVLHAKSSDQEGMPSQKGPAVESSAIESQVAQADPAVESAFPAEPQVAHETPAVEGEQSTSSTAHPHDAEAVAALLTSKGIQLDDEQLAAVVKALDGAKDRQGFYRRIIRALKKERGLPLYHQVREHFAEMQALK